MLVNQEFQINWHPKPLWLYLNLNSNEPTIINIFTYFGNSKFKQIGAPFDFYLDNPFGDRSFNKDINEIQNI